MIHKANESRYPDVCNSVIHKVDITCYFKWFLSDKEQNVKTLTAGYDT